MVTNIDMFPNQADNYTEGLYYLQKAWEECQLITTQFEVLFLLFKKKWCMWYCQVLSCNPIITGSGKHVRPKYFQQGTKKLHAERK